MRQTTTDRRATAATGACRRMGGARRTMSERALRYGMQRRLRERRRRLAVRPPEPDGQCTLREAAMAYFPGRRPETAVSCLRRAVKGDPQLAGDLQRAGWRPGLRYLTPRQKRVYDYYFG